MTYNDIEMSVVSDFSIIFKPSYFGQWSGHAPCLTHEKEGFALDWSGLLTVIWIPLRAIKPHLETIQMPWSI